MKLILHFGDKGLLKSPPARGRGLKPKILYENLKIKVSPPARGRGLKLEFRFLFFQVSGRPPRGGVD